MSKRGLLGRLDDAVLGPSPTSAEARVTWLRRARERGFNPRSPQVITTTAVADLIDRVEELERRLALMESDGKGA